MWGADVPGTFQIAVAPATTTAAMNADFAATPEAAQTEAAVACAATLPANRPTLET
jgi:hypothetical protein